MPTTLPYGSWPSPITAAQAAAAAPRLDGARFVGDDVWWGQSVPEEGGRTAVMRRGADGDETVLPAPWDARSRVHEYGGGAWTVTDDGRLVFAEKSDQRLRILVPGAEPEPLTPADAGMRFADLQIVGDEVWAVRETHGTGAAVPPRDIVRIPLDGSASGDARALGRVVGGSDFVAYPRVSPDGTRLAWIAWDHPNMPWDETRLRVGDLRGGEVRSWRDLAGGPGESVLQPEWTGPGALTFVSDRTGWWNLYRWADDETSALAPAEAETGGPLWNLGVRWFLPLADGRILAVRTDGGDTLVVLDPVSGAIRQLPAVVTSRVLLDDVRGSRVLLRGAGAQTFGAVWMLDLDDPEGRPHPVAGGDAGVDAAWLAVPRAVTVDGPHGPVHAYAYPPTSPEAQAPDGELAPYLVLAHGGPTASASGGASLDVAYFTSRGIGVLDVDYGGSTGYGRAYRDRLRGQWGIVDRDDVIAAAAGLADQGLADGARLAIKGGSAGGWTVLCALTASDRFAAGISRYGVADLRALAADTHDFEARYVDGLVGPLPEAEAVYIERSPLSHLDGFTTPMLLEQGLDDAVVPPSQSEAVRDALAAKGIASAYLTFEGEGHGFRRSETIVRTLEAEYAFLGAVLGFATPGVDPIALD
ncbi:peptidase S9 [Microbacterium mangrovi]|uniref:Peptidase S9 n=1 Tax=Microbacterium mangrovi TaxID=1348253 RepID=A0A0B2A2Z3_9MICO|nr:prolyl oligopeptidase family serine peptidase [Microbacterium mangrovi]KHK96159.1 peptidase S9 [Microbacterium mangrovi]